MSNQVDNSSGIGFAAAQPTTMLGLGAIGTTVKFGGISKALKGQNTEAFRALAEKMNMSADAFTKSQALSEAHSAYWNLAKQNAKYQKKLAKIKKLNNGTLAGATKLPLWEKFKNFVGIGGKKTGAETIAEITKRGDEAAAALGKANKAIEGAATATNTGKALQHLDDTLGLGGAFVKNATGTVAKATVKSTAKNLATNIGRNFKKELGFKNGTFNYILTGISFVPRIFSKVIPTFKEKGVAAGLKETGKVLIQAGTDLVSYAAGGAIGRSIGSFIGGAVFKNAAAARICGQFADSFTSLLLGQKICKIVDKAIGADDSTSPQKKTTS